MDSRGNRERTDRDKRYIAHSAIEPTGGRAFHGLRVHLESVATLAAEHARAFQVGEWAYLAGLWHDLGKYRPGFQSYVRRDPEAHIEGRLPRASEKTHSASEIVDTNPVMTF